MPVNAELDDRRVQVAIFAKAPIPGFVKTRLVPVLDSDGAARLHRRLVRQALETAICAGIGGVTLWCTPNAQHGFFQALRMSRGVDCLVQAIGDLGQRMHTAFRVHCASGPLLLIGTDCPVLRPSHLRKAALALLDGQDAVFYPAEDGGYVLVGLRQPQPELFGGILWSTPAVMPQTRLRARALGLSVREFETLWDVDRPADLERMRSVDPLSWPERA